MSSTLELRVRTRVACNCGHPLSNVTITLDGESVAAETMASGAMVVKVACPRCKTRAEQAIESTDWRRDP